MLFAQINRIRIWKHCGILRKPSKTYSLTVMRSDCIGIHGDILSKLNCKSETWSGWTAELLTLSTLTEAISSQLLKRKSIVLIWCLQNIFQASNYNKWQTDRLYTKYNETESEYPQNGTKNYQRHSLKFMMRNVNNEMQISESVPYSISAKSMKRFMRCIEKYL